MLLIFANLKQHLEQSSRTMEGNPIFRQTRLRLAVWYTLVMGGIVGLSGLGVYSVVAHAYYPCFVRVGESNRPNGYRALISTFCL